MVVSKSETATSLHNHLSSTNRSEPVLMDASKDNPQPGGQRRKKLGRHVVKLGCAALASAPYPSKVTLSGAGLFWSGSVLNTPMPRTAMLTLHMLMEVIIELPMKCHSKTVLKTITNA